MDRKRLVATPSLVCPEILKDILICNICLESQVNDLHNTICCKKILCRSCNAKLADKSRCPCCRQIVWFLSKVPVLDEILNTVLQKTTLIPHSTLPEDMPKKTQKYRSIISEGEIGILYHTSTIRKKLYHTGLAQYYGYQLTKGKYDVTNIIRSTDIHDYEVVQHYEIVENELDLSEDSKGYLSAAKLTNSELVHICIGICDTLLYLYSQDYYGVNISKFHLHISKDLSEIKFSPRIRRVMKFELTERSKEIRQLEKNDVDDLKALMASLGVDWKLVKPVETISDIRYEIFSILDQKNLTLCDQYTIGNMDSGHNWYTYPFKALNCDSRWCGGEFYKECQECNYWFIGEIKSSCMYCQKPRIRMAPIRIRNFGSVQFDKCRKILELRQFISKVLYCNVDAMSLFYVNDEPMIDNKAIYESLCECYQTVVLRINYRLA